MAYLETFVGVGVIFFAILDRWETNQDLAPLIIFLATIQHIDAVSIGTTLRKGIFLVPLMVHLCAPSCLFEESALNRLSDCIYRCFWQGATHLLYFRAHLLLLYTDTCMKIWGRSQVNFTLFLTYYGEAIARLLKIDSFVWLRRVRAVVSAAIFVSALLKVSAVY